MPHEIFRVGNTDDIVAAVTDAGARQQRLRVVGGGSKLPMLGNSPVQGEIDMRGLAGILKYEPEELVLSARAGTRLAEIETALIERRQMLAPEPPDYAALLGTSPASTTLGGFVASGFAGPRRLAAGNVRDHVLGFAAISGLGEPFRAGAAVMKNVTGYDLPKLMTGSWGTLAILTELTLRVLPLPDYSATLLIEGLGDQQAVSAMTQALAAPLEVSAAAHLPGAHTAIRLDGFRASVDDRLAQLVKLIGQARATRVLHAEESGRFWKQIRDVEPFHGNGRIVWRLSLPASRSVAVVAAIAGSARHRVIYDWGGSLVWLELESESDAAADAVRTTVAASGGYAMLMRAAASVREQVPTQHPPAPALAALMRRIKLGFDPHEILGWHPIFPAGASAT